MAEKSKEKKGGNKLVGVIIVMIIVLIWLAIFAALIKLDVGGFGSKVLYPVLKDVPIINTVLPSVDDKTSESGTPANEKYTSLAQAVEKINELEKKLGSYDTNNTANSDYITQLENEIANLKTYKDNQDTFEQRVLDFDKNVVFGEEAPDIEEYKKYYEEINPDNASAIYAQVVQQYQYDERVKTQADRYGKMDPAAAAKILQEMTSGDLDLVSGILSEMNTTKSAAILAEMDVDTAAQITKKMSYVK